MTAKFSVAVEGVRNSQLSDTVDVCANESHVYIDVEGYEGGLVSVIVERESVSSALGAITPQNVTSPVVVEQPSGDQRVESDGSARGAVILVLLVFVAPLILGGLEQVLRLSG